MTPNDVPRKLSWKGLLSMLTCFLYLGVHHRALLTSIWEVVFWTVTNCDSHKLRHYRRNLWFVAICDHSRDGANWVQQHWKRVLCTWESTHVHFCKLSPTHVHFCKLSPTHCSVYLGEYPCSFLTWIWKLTFLPILVLFHWYTCFYVYQKQYP